MNFSAYLDQQKNEDTRAFVVHAPAGGGKTAFARAVRARRTDVYLLDLQKHFVTHPDLHAIKTFGSAALQTLLLNWAEEHAVIFVDNWDFLWNTWRDEECAQFLHWIGVQLRSPSVSPKTFVFFLQTDDKLKAAKTPNTRKHQFVRPLSDFDAVI